MDTTFITIHDLSRDARILYASDSIVDILGHTPDEVVNRPAWEFFHPDELPVAQDFHSRGVLLDKAAVLAYCQIRNRHGDWVGCECCFSVVYDVMVCCTSIYRRGSVSQKRAVEAPVVRKLFTSSPKDPRYHMLTHLSSKFNLGPQQQTHEPRAALFLNRFTRTLTVMYATSGIEQVIGIPSAEMKGKSFYYCIQENCLEDAVRVLETAKGNDSIAYLRFWFRDPRAVEGAGASSEDETDETMTDVTTEDEEESDAGASRRAPPASLPTQGSSSTNTSSGMDSSTSADDSRQSSSGNGDSSSLSASQHHSGAHTLSPAASNTGNDPIELEAVVSCTSDGLVVCLRRARPAMPPSAQPQPPADAQPQYARGVFAAPWGQEPVFLPPLPQPYANAARMGLQPPVQPGITTFGGPAQADFMQSIRDVAVFAWALTGINGCLAEYTRGKPMGESQPPEGFPVWAPDGATAGTGREIHSSISSSSGNGPYPSPGSRDPFGDPGLDGKRFS